MALTVWLIVMAAAAAGFIVQVWERGIDRGVLTLTSYSVSGRVSMQERTCRHTNRVIWFPCRTRNRQTVTTGAVGVAPMPLGLVMVAVLLMVVPGVAEAGNGCIVNNRYGTAGGNANAGNS